MPFNVKHILDKRSVIAVMSGIILVGFICALLMLNYRAQIRLHDSAIRQMVGNVDKQARGSVYFFSERRVDIKDLAQSREIDFFFENKALGMSMEYGLKASLIQMKHRFDRLIRDRIINGKAAYTCLMFIDEQGEILVNTGEDPIAASSRNHVLEHLKRDHREPMIMACNNEGRLNVLVCMAYYFKNRYAGQILARINTERIFENLLSGDEYTPQIFFYFDWGNGHLTATSPHGPALPPDVTASIRTGSHSRLTLSDKNHEPVQMIAVKQAIPETTFHLIGTAPLRVIWGHTRPIDLLVAMGVLAVLAVGVVVFLWNLNTGRLILKTRLDEEKIRKAEIENKNIQLEAYQNNLEDLVRQRTRELEDAQRELVHQAMEAGRAQLAAITLHNIGNAITPVSVYAEMIGGEDQEQTLRYLSECYEDVFSRKEDMGAYVTTDHRGIKVAAYMKSLILNLEEKREKSRDIKDKIMQGISYISQILTLQQAYAPGELNMKEKVNLNHMVTDALNMQENTLSTRGIRLDLHLCQDIPGLMIEKNKLMQVIVNLIKNSCDALSGVNGSKDKQIQITTYKAGHAIGLTIRDTGFGVAPENLERIFSFGVSSKGSSGFGLYYCKTFVEQNNGRLTLQSPGPDQGATVTVEFETTDAREAVQ